VVDGSRGAGSPIGFAAALRALRSRPLQPLPFNPTLGILNMPSMKLKLSIAALVGAVITVVLHINIASKRVKSSGSKRGNIWSPPQCMLGLIIFASEKGDKLPNTLEEAGLNSNQFELLFKGR
jgi:hypothetical protein